MIYKTGDCGSVCNWGRVFKLIRVLLLFTASVVSDSLRSHGLQHARLPCPSPSPGLCSNSCTLSQWCHPIILTSVAPFSSCPQSFPASGSFPTSQLFALCGQSIGDSALAFSPSNEYSGLVSFNINGSDLPVVQGTLKSLLQHHSVHLFFSAFMVQLSHPYMTTEKS